MDINKKIHDTFNPPPSLDGEDWLIPSSSIWDAIEEEVKPKKRKRYGLILFSLLGILIFFFLLVFSQRNISLQSGSLDTSSLNIDSKNPVVSASIDKKQQNNSPPLFNEDSLDENDKKLENLTTDHIKTNDPLSDNTFARNHLTNQYFVSPLSAPATDFSNNNNVSIHSRSLLSVSNEEHKFHSISFSQIKKLEIESLLLDKEEVEKLVVISTEDNTLGNKWQIEFNTGLSQWNINLNDSYKSALEPASFNSTNGTGFYANLAFMRAINSRISLGIASSFNEASFRSGHNATVTYQQANEITETNNDFDLTMASPLGFIESTIIIQRNENASIEEELDLALHNLHTIGTIDLNLIARYKLYSYRNFNFTIEGGAGFNYLIYNKNRLESFDINKSNYTSINAEIISDQENINRLRPQVSLGSSMNYNVSPLSQIFVTYRLNRDIRNAYQFNDFSTVLSNQRFGLGITHKL